jgi:hypothetical protein
MAQDRPLKLGSHADHREAAPVERDHPADQGTVAPEPALPVAMAEDDRRGRALRLSLSGPQQQAQGRLHPGQREVVRRDDFDPRPSGVWPGALRWTGVGMKAARSEKDDIPCRKSR